MKRLELDEALAQLASQRCPEIDPNWQCGVMQRIRARAATTASAFNLRDVFMPHLGLGSLSAALAVAVGIGAAVGLLRPHYSEPLAEMRSPMAIFSAQPPGMPATLILADR